jgi:hypothetical protein
MRTSPDADELDLPPLDGALGGDEPDGTGESLADELDGPEHHHELGDAFDDATSEGDPFEEIVVEGAEAGWLLDAEEGGKPLDVEAFDVSLSDEEALLEPDEPEARVPDEDLGDGEETVHSDGGEEGPLADDEELREEDLPALDADDDGDVADELLFERGTLETGEELHWDDRAWARAPLLADDGEVQDADDSGRLLVPGDDAKHAARDATWKRLEEGSTVTAVAMVPGDSVVLALDRAGRPLLVRIQADGVARIIAEIDTSAADDDVEACRVAALRWDAARGCLVATGTFGGQAFRPA